MNGCLIKLGQNWTNVGSGSCPGGSKEAVFLSKASRPTLNPYHPYMQSVPAVVCPGEQPGGELDRMSLNSVEVKKVCSCASSPYMPLWHGG